MKKLLLFGLLGVPFLGSAQQSSRLPLNPPPPAPEPITKTITIPKEGTTLKSITSPRFKYVAPPLKQNITSANGITYPFFWVGTTKYDLQTNASVGRRVMVHAGGKVSVTWTYSSLSSNWDDRGVGYNHFNGTSWLPHPTERIQGGQGTDKRNGWPSLLVVGNEEVVFAHTPANGGFFVSKNGSIGSNTWTTPAVPVLGEVTPGERPIWGRVANNGNIIHVLSNFADSSQESPSTTVRAGVRDPLVYSRSLDGGNTWPIKNQLLPGYDNNLTLEGGGDQYAIDVRDSIVAIVVGGLGDHVLLWKSTNNGNTFTLKFLDSLDFAPYNNNKIIGTERRTNDGSVEVLIDNNGKIHAFWGLSAVTQRNISRDSALFTPWAAGIIHWDEYTNTSDTIVTALDLDNNGAFDIENPTFAARTSGTVNSAARYGNTSLITMPSACVDASNNIYCVYSSPVERQLSFDNENFRDVYVVYSTNNGASWSAPQNLTNTVDKEDVFACVNKRVDTHLHFIWQQDDNPGTELQNADPEALNNIFYAAVPASQILSNSIGNGAGVGMKKVKNETFGIEQNYPNPAQSETNVRVHLYKNSDLKLTIVDMVGHTVLETSADNVNKGIYDFDLNVSNLRSGVYFYTVEAGAIKETKKMIIQ